MTIDANYIALSNLNDAMRQAMKKLENGLESCGKLDHPEAKITESAKSYFRQQAEEHKQAIVILQGIHRELSDRLWKASRSSVQEGS